MVARGGTRHKTSPLLQTPSCRLPSASAGLGLQELYPAAHSHKANNSNISDVRGNCPDWGKVAMIVLNVWKPYWPPKGQHRL